MARQQLAGSVSCLAFYLFIQIHPLSFFSILISQRERKASDERDGHDHPFKRGEKEKVKYCVA